MYLQTTIHSVSRVPDQKLHLDTDEISNWNVHWKSLTISLRTGPAGNTGLIIKELAMWNHSDRSRCWSCVGFLMMFITVQFEHSANIHKFGFQASDSGNSTYAIFKAEELKHRMTKGLAKSHMRKEWENQESHVSGQCFNCPSILHLLNHLLLSLY